MSTAAAAAVWASAGQRPAGIRVENKTRSLVVESVSDRWEIPTGEQEGRRHFKITVRNGYSKPVAAYCFRQIDNSLNAGERAGVEINGATVGWVLPPGETQVTPFGAAAEGEVVIVVSAVLLEDGSGDGEPEELSKLRNVRAGVKTAYQHAIPLLRRAAADDSLTPDALIQSLKSEIAAIPRGNPRVSGLNRGLEDGKDVIARDLVEIENHLLSGRGLRHRAEHTKLLTPLEEALAKL